MNAIVPQRKGIAYLNKIYCTAFEWQDASMRGTEERILAYTEGGGALTRTMNTGASTESDHPPFDSELVDSELALHSDVNITKSLRQRARYFR